MDINIDDILKFLITLITICAFRRFQRLGHHSFLLSLILMAYYNLHILIGDIKSPRDD